MTDSAIDPTRSSTSTTSSSLSISLLQGLNNAQREAVTASSRGGLFVAGVPGCGKTRTLTSRVAWLLKGDGAEKLDHSRVVVVTFTNKAANEMKERLNKILGEEITGQLIMGTFHSICAQYLRRYGSLVSLSPNFSILDRQDANAMIKRILSTDALKDVKNLKPVTILDKISNAKSKMMNPDSYRADQENNKSRDEREDISRVWAAYQEELTRTNAVDFDDLLIYGHKLFKNYPHVVAKIQSVLVDEFQDTSVTQYEIAKYISRASNSMTVVGDPDQAIYGWRNAEVENLNRMITDFKPCRQIYLEENYRSTNSILQLALSVIQQDSNRIPKSLYSSHPLGTPPILHKAINGEDEAQHIATKIQEMMKDFKSLEIDYNDFAILLRAGYQSLSIELALQKIGIPCIFRGGHKFFDRQEVKDILSYLQLIANPHHSSALERVANVPKRSLGNKAVNSIFAKSFKDGTSPWTVFESVVDDNDDGGMGLSTVAKRGMKQFVTVIRSCQREMKKLDSVAELINFLLKQIDYQTYLEKTFKDKAEDKLLNIDELKNYAVLVAREGPAVQLNTEKEEEEDGNDEGKAEIAQDSNDGNADQEKSTTATSETVNDQLNTFLSATSLATDHDTQQATSDGRVPKVVISTVHSAKGLEWPIVFIPGIENGTFPFYRATESKEVDEERRLLYVAITRAQTHCLLSWAPKRMGGGSERSQSLSSFIEKVPKQLYATQLPKTDESTMREVARVLGRTSTSVAATEEREGEEKDGGEPAVIFSPSRYQTPEKKRPIPSSSSNDGYGKKKIKY